MYLLLIITVFIENAYAFEKESRPEKKTEPIMHDGKPLNDESWHYYVDKELIPEEEIILPPPPPPAVSSGKGSEQKPEAFSVEWFKQNIAIIQARAMDNPNDKDAVRAHLYAQKVMLDKAELFAHQVSYQQSIDPNLQEGVRVPIVGAARTMNLMQRSEHREEAVNEILKKGGLIYFHDPNCKFCIDMVPSINYVKKVYPHADLRVNTIGDTTQIKGLKPDIPVYIDSGVNDLFEINYFPTFALYVPPQSPNDMPQGHIISQGKVYFREMEKRLINIGFETGLLDDSFYDTIFRDQKGLMSPDVLKAMPADIADDPVKMVNAIIDSMDPNYNPMNPKHNQSSEKRNP